MKIKLEKLSVAILTCSPKRKVEMYRNNLQFSKNEKPPTGTAEGKQKVIAEKV